MLYTVKLKTRNNTPQNDAEIIKIEAADVNLTTAQVETEHGTIETPCDYNFLSSTDGDTAVSVGRIPFEHVLYIIRG